jgi:2-hydroxychromene-2-carboxylate isomerase
MKGLSLNDASEFLRVLSKIGLDATDMTAVEIDRHIEAFRQGYRTPSQLTAAVAAGIVPERITIYAHIDPEDLESIANQLGLEGDVFRNFTGSANKPIELSCSVESTGCIIVEEMEGQAVCHPVVL